LSPQDSTHLTCIDFSRSAIAGYGRLARLQALKDYFRRSQHGLDLGNVELRGVEPLTSCMPCNSGCSLTRPDMTPACDYRVWTGLEEYQGVQGTADLLADLPLP